MARKWTGLKNPLVTSDANLLFDFPSLNLAEVDNVEVPYDPSGDGVREITDWLASMSLTIIKPDDPWTGENQTKVTVEYGRRIYSFVNPQHALMFKLAFGGK